MNNYFASLLLYLALRFNEERSLRFATCGALVIGLGLTNQVNCLVLELFFTRFDQRFKREESLARVLDIGLGLIH